MKRLELDIPSNINQLSLVNVKADYDQFKVN